MRRREFVIGGAGALAGIVVGGLGTGPLVDLVVPGPTPEKLRIDTWLQGLDALGPLGVRRLEILAAADSQAADPETVAPPTDALAARLGLAGDRPVRVTTLERRVRAAIEGDYRDGRMCDIDGWQLSETECDLAVLYVQRVGVAEARTASPQEGHIVAVEGWGPRSTRQGERFNEQRDGHSGLWFRAAGAPAWLQVVVDGDPMPTFVNGDVVTSGLHGDTQERVLSRPGRYPIVFLDEMNGVIQTVGHLEVRPPERPARLADGAESPVFCEVEDWGPRETRVGGAVNPQPGGAIGLWIHIGCCPPGTRLRAGGTDLETVVRRDGRVTARLPLEMVAEPGHLELVLHDPESGESLAVGSFSVTGATP